jgi:hypothetical protein
VLANASVGGVKDVEKFGFSLAGSHDARFGRLHLFCHVPSLHLPLLRFPSFLLLLSRVEEVELSHKRVISDEFGFAVRELRVLLSVFEVVDDLLELRSRAQASVVYLSVLRRWYHYTLPEENSFCNSAARL